MGASFAATIAFDGQVAEARNRTRTARAQENQRLRESNALQCRTPSRSSAGGTQRHPSKLTQSIDDPDVVAA
jgi:hypothetical protein